LITTELAARPLSFARIKTALTPVGVDAGVIRFLFHAFVSNLYVTATTAIQNAMPIQRLISEKITNRLRESSVYRSHLGLCFVKVIT